MIAYTPDSAGNVIKEEHLSVPSPWTETATFSGDQLQTRTFSGSKTGSFKYFYDDAGNMDCVTTSAGSRDMCTPAEGTQPNAAVLSVSAFDTGDRLLSHRQFGPSATSGAIETKKKSTYDYDVFDRPVEQTDERAGVAAAKVTLMKYVGLSDDVSTGASLKHRAARTLPDTKTYSYDAFGRRIGLNDKQGSTSTDFTYLRHPWVDLVAAQRVGQGAGVLCVQSLRRLRQGRSSFRVPVVDGRA